jgi:hypothetical protein
MSLGLGIFLSSTLFALLTLYWITRDRWRWRFIARRIGMALGALVVLVVLVGGAFYGYAEYKDMPRRQDTYAGIQLGATMAEILYLKGNPSAVLVEERTDDLPEGFYRYVALAEIPKGKKVEDYVMWEYTPAGTQDGRVSVVFNDATRKVRLIACYSVSDRYACPALLGVWPRDDEGTVVGKLGTPTKEALDGTVKRLEYGQFSARFFLVKTKVYMMQVLEYDTASKAK